MNSAGLYENKALCSGCGACLNICNHSAITMKDDDDGFEYPVINENICVDCGLCKSACQYKNPKLSVPKSVLAISNKNYSTVNKSSSGGIFPLLANSIISTGGAVYGASFDAYDQVKKVKHTRITEIAEIIRLQGSKYVQSEINYAYQQVKKDLESDKEVLFSGTPCQVSGLYGFLNKEYKNLYTIDLVCHGVPSPRMFKSYIDYLEKKWNDAIIDFSFRDKTRGWSDFYVKAKLKSGKEKSSFSKIHAYYYYFLNADIYRENCYSCPFAGKNRVGDITLGDFWGFESAHRELISDWKKELFSGISCMLINSEKGLGLFECINDDVKIIESSYSKVANSNGQLKRPVALSSDRTTILDIWKKRGYKGLQKYYVEKSGRQYFYMLLRKSISPYIKKLIKRI